MVQPGHDIVLCNYWEYIRDGQIAELAFLASSLRHMEQDLYSDISKRWVESFGIDKQKFESVVTHSEKGRIMQPLNGVSHNLPSASVFNGSTTFSYIGEIDEKKLDGMIGNIQSIKNYMPQGLQEYLTKLIIDFSEAQNHANIYRKPRSFTQEFDFIDDTLARTASRLIAHAFDLNDDIPFRENVRLSDQEYTKEKADFLYQWGFLNDYIYTVLSNELESMHYKTSDLIELMDGDPSLHLTNVTTDHGAYFHAEGEDTLKGILLTGINPYRGNRENIASFELGNSNYNIRFTVKYGRIESVHPYTDIPEILSDAVNNIISEKRGDYLPRAGADLQIDSLLETHDFFGNVDYYIKGSDPSQRRFNWWYDGDDSQILRAINKAGGSESLVFANAYQANGLRRCETGYHVGMIGVYVPKM
ncbi:MAG: hypothetical protein NDI94_01540 [Candidatus Woesearchaeota archaeon]|nr:hypothetical protein [Candidatus Woesearchaeota archaeon]